MEKQRAEVLAVIPVRLSSTRLPNKMLLKETGKYLFQHVYEQASKSKLVNKVMIAVDDEVLYNAAKSFTDNVVMTSAKHQSGTDRIHEVARKIDCDKIINVQGDEPEIDPDAIDIVASLLRDSDWSTLACPIDESLYSDPNVVKAMCVHMHYGWVADDFVRIFDKTLSGYTSVYRHIGIYGYSKKMLYDFVSTAQTDREISERLEQLRLIDIGLRPRVGLVKCHSPGVDTREDYEAFKERQALSGR